MDAITLPQIEAAINYWRNVSPSVGDESRLCAEAAALAAPYALMIMSHRREIALAELGDLARTALSGWTAAVGPRRFPSPAAVLAAGGRINP